MSDLIDSGAELNSETGVLDVGTSPGALMRDAREASGIHIDVLAAALKITVDRLDALEADRYTDLPDMVFARALAASACRILKLDPVPVLALMPKNQAQSLTAGRSDINASFRDAAEKKNRIPFSRKMAQPLGVAVMILLIGAGVLFFLPERGDKPENVVVSSAPALAANEVGESLTINQPVSIAQDLESGASVALSALVNGETADVKVLDAAAGSTEVVQASSHPADGLLEFRAREKTWIQVRDATKKIVFERIMAKGEAASVAGNPPLSVVIGRADSTEVFVRGTPFDLTSVAKENVARFEVK